MLGDFPAVLTDAVIESMDAHHSMATRILGDEKVKEGLARILLDIIYKKLERSSYQ